MSRVENPVGEPIPEFSHFPENGAKDPSPLNRQHTRGVFPHEPLRFFASGDFDEFKGEVSFLGFQALSLPRLGEILARGSAHQQVDLGVRERPAVLEPRHVPEVRNVRIAVLQDCAGEWENLGEPCGFPAKRLPGYRRCADPAAHASVGKHNVTALYE